MSKRILSLKRLRMCLTLSIIFLSSFLLFACGSSSGGSSSSNNVEAPPPASTVSGVAATGAAIVGNAYLKDSLGGEIGPYPIGLNGSFSFDVTGLTPPYYIKAVETDPPNREFYSASMASGTGNVNPATHLALAVATGEPDLSLIYANPTAYPIVTQADIENALDDINSIIESLLESYGITGIDPFTDPFVIGVGLDLLFDDIDFNYDPSTGDVAFINSSGTQFLQANIGSITSPYYPLLSISGNGITNPFSGQASLSLDVSESSMTLGTLLYRLGTIYLQSTSITEVSIIDNTVTIAGLCNVNGSSGYSFYATIIDGSPDQMQMIINDPGSLPYHDSGLNDVNDGVGYTIVRYPIVGT